MDNEENKNQDLNYDFNFENQVAKDEQKPEMEMLEDDEFEEIVETNNNSSEIKNDVDTNLATNTEEVKETPEENESKEEKIKTVKILGKEFNFEDVVLAVIGIVLIISIFVMPKIMNMFR